MLEPESRHLLTDALRPPDGYAVERALATTYTLDLTSVLLAPLAMAAYDQRHATELDGAATPLALLESIRRHAEHTTVLCQAAGIHVPPAYPKLAAFAEGCVAEVAPPPGRTFHPKMWVLRFVDDDGGRRHRFACLSRNLTGDRSWDTVLICDEDPDAKHTLDPGPISTFVEELLESTVRPLTAVRREQLRDLCESLRHARLALPEPFTEGRVIALGTPSGDGWPLPDTADTCAVISPFLDVGTVGRLPRSRGAAETGSCSRARTPSSGSDHELWSTSTCGCCNRWPTPPSPTRAPRRLQPPTCPKGCTPRSSPGRARAAPTS